MLTTSLNSLKKKGNFTIENITKWVKKAIPATINIFHAIFGSYAQPWKLVKIKTGEQPYNTINDNVSLAVLGKLLTFAKINPGNASTNKNTTVIKTSKKLIICYLHILAYYNFTHLTAICQTRNTLFIKNLK